MERVVKITCCIIVLVGSTQLWSMMRQEPQPFGNTETEKQRMPFGNQFSTPPLSSSSIMPDEEELDRPTENERLATAERDRSVPTIFMTPGSSHNLEGLHNEHERYAIQSREHAPFLHREELDEHTGFHRIMIPHDARPGRFTVFKAQGTGANHTQLIPAFHVEIKPTPAGLPKPMNFKGMVKNAWEAQEKAEQQFFETMKTQFEFLTQQIRTIWFDVSMQDDTFETTQASVKEEPITLHVNEKKVVAHGTGGSISSSNPRIISGEMNAIKKNTIHSKKPSVEWEFSIVAKEVGKGTITYCTNNKTYIQPVIVKKELVGQFKQPHRPEAEEKTDDERDEHHNNHLQKRSHPENHTHMFDHARTSHEDEHNDQDHTLSEENHEQNKMENHHFMPTESRQLFGSHENSEQHTEDHERPFGLEK